KFYCHTVNIDTLWSLLPQEVKNNDTANKGTAPLIGYFNVLGKGVLLSRQPVVVKAKLVSKNAEKKIKENGGVVVITA
ncbi:hypothetical protein MTR67_038296, partial [Solanum verrucosum]